jgi:hypothetical protein
MRKPNWVLNDCRETDADEEQDDDRSRARLQRPLVSMMRVYAGLGRLPTWLLKPGVGVEKVSLEDALPWALDAAVVVCSLREFD